MSERLITTWEVPGHLFKDVKGATRYEDWCERLAKDLQSRGYDAYVKREYFERKKGDELEYIQYCCVAENAKEEE